jgi:hypothetical protein
MEVLGSDGLLGDDAAGVTMDAALPRRGAWMDIMRVG